MALMANATNGMGMGDVHQTRTNHQPIPIHHQRYNAL